MSTNAIAILGMISTLLLAYGLDYWVQSARQTASRTFEMTPLMWGAGLANLLLAGAFLLLAWFVAVRAKRSNFRAIVLIANGLLATFSVGIYFALPSIVLPFDPVPFLASTSHLSLAGAFIAVLGLADLLHQR